MPTAPSVRATKVTSGTATFTPSGTWTDGDLMIVVAGSISTYPSTPAGWTSVLTTGDGWDDLVDDFGNMYYRVCWMYKSGTASSTFTNATEIAGIALYDTAASSPVDVYSSNAGSNTVTGVTTTQDNDLIVGFAAHYYAGTFTPPSGMTEQFDAQLSWFSNTIATVVQASAGATGNKTFTPSNFGPWDHGAIAMLIAIKGAEAAATGKHNTFEGGSVGVTISPANSGASGTAFDNVVIT